MKKKVVIRKQFIGENLIYACIWAVVYLIPIMNSQLMSEARINIDNVLVAWIKITPYLLLFTFHNLVLLKLILQRRRYVIYLLTCIVLLFSIFALVDVYELHVAPKLTFSVDTAAVQPRHASLTDLAWYWNILLGAFMFAANLGIKVLYKSMRDDEDMEVLKRQTIQAEMYYLKYQINPHFFMNTLNNIHALIDIDPSIAQKCVLELSNMMRYVVYDSGTENVSMRKDISFIENYIELMRIRYTQDVDIRFNYPKSLSSKVAVPPLIFIVFVENAFKHGVSYSKPSYIYIDITCDRNTVTARFENSVVPSKKERKAGIGLDNVRKRLELIYGSNYALRIDDRSADKYTVTLTIPTLNNDKMLGN